MLLASRLLRLTSEIKPVSPVTFLLQRTSLNSELLSDALMLNRSSHCHGAAPTPPRILRCRRETVSALCCSVNAFSTAVQERGLLGFSSEDTAVLHHPDGYAAHRTLLRIQSIHLRGWAVKHCHYCVHTSRHWGLFQGISEPQSQLFHRIKAPTVDRRCHIWLMASWLRENLASVTNFVEFSWTGSILTITPFFGA